VIILRDLEQLSMLETAQRLNATVPAVKSRLLRGRHLLAQALRRSVGQEFAFAA
jgi:DNA-directed RNA polymerase specialized sigma24 family protein